jgi:hypothetical protein
MERSRVSLARAAQLHGRSGRLNITAYPSENFAYVMILQNAESAISGTLMSSKWAGALEGSSPL